MVNNALFPVLSLCHSILARTVNNVNNKYKKHIKRIYNALYIVPYSPDRLYENIVYIVYLFDESLCRLTFWLKTIETLKNFL